MELVEPIREIKQINSMKVILKNRSLRDYCLFTVGINSGLRIGDLLELKVGDVIDQKGKVVDRISLREGKTGKVKDFPLGSTSVKTIEEYIKSEPGFSRNTYLFKSKRPGKHEHITRQYAWMVINEAARSIGIKDKIGTHTLRKTFGYHSYKQGKDITLIQDLLNHSAPSITLRYIGITRDQRDSVYLGLNL